MKLGFPVAIVGVGVVFPAPLEQCRSLAAFWQLLLEGKSAIDERRNRAWIYEPQQTTGGVSAPPDSVATPCAARLPVLPAGWNAIEAANPWLAEADTSVRIAVSACADALAQVRVKPTASTRSAAFLGQIALPSEKLAHGLAQRVLQDHAAEQNDDRARQVMAGPLQAIAELFDVHGHQQAIDAACASSLFALQSGMAELASGRADLVLAGGLGVPDNLYVHMGFTQLAALSPSGRCAPLTTLADGLVPGEGAAIFALKRLDDALAAGEQILAVVRAAAITNDRQGPVLLPQREGQERALRQSYAAAKLAPLDVDLLICHATGTPTGDRVELASLQAVASENQRDQTCWLRAPKANVGHWLTGAGAAAVLEAVLALKHRTIAPQPHADHALAAIGEGGDRFRLPTTAQPWPELTHRPPRVAVSGFGFGGTNAHLVIEAYDPKFEVVMQAQPALGATAAIVGMGDSEAWREPGSDDALRLPVQGLQTAPRDFVHALPHQAHALAAAWLAVSAQQLHSRLKEIGEGAVFVGSELDARTVRYHLRWALLGQAQRDPARGNAWQEAAAAVSPPLDADRTLGGLASVGASRIARALGIDGPAYLLSHAQDPGGAALRSALHAITTGEVAWALAIDLQAQRDEWNPTGAPDRAQALLVVHPNLAQRLGWATFGRVSFAEQTNVGDQPLIANIQRALTPSTRDDPAQPLTATVQGMGVAVVHTAEDLPWPTNAGWRCFCCHASSQASLAADLRALANLAQANVHLDPLARDHWATLPTSNAGAWRVTILVDSPTALIAACHQIASELGSEPQTWSTPTWRAAAAHATLTGETALLFPGSGIWHPDVGRHLLRDQPALHHWLGRHRLLAREVFRPDLLWSGAGQIVDTKDHVPQWMAAQVGYGTLVAQVLRELGLSAHAFLGSSLGESTALVAANVWQDPRALFEAVTSGPLFSQWLAGSYDLAHRAFGIAASEPAWSCVTVKARAQDLQSQLADHPRVFLLLVHGPETCVLGGEPQALAAFCHHHHLDWLPIDGAPSVHCRLVEGEAAKLYRAVHDHACVEPIPDLRIYSMGHGGVCPLNRNAIADALLRQAQSTVDFPAIARLAHRDGVRFFLDVGPGGSIAWQTRQALRDAAFDHVVVAVSPRGCAGIDDLVMAATTMWTRGASLDLGRLHRWLSRHWAMLVPTPSFVVRDQPTTARERLALPRAHVPTFETAALIDAAWASQREVLRAHESFLRVHALAQHLLLQHAGQTAPRFAQTKPADPPTLPSASLFLDRQGCLALALGRLGDVLGPAFAEVDAFPTRVRLPDEPLMLVDRIVEVQGEALTMGGGRVVTEHDVMANGWYLDGGRIPTCIAVEAGQADLFLSGYLGIDRITRGLAMYRLLDAVVTFKSELPRPGEIIRYDIRIDHFFELDHTWFFRFWFDASVDGRPLMTMRSGCAGFFTEQALAAGKGLFGYPLAFRQATPGRVCARWVTPTVGTLSEASLDALRAGDLVEAFGETHRGLPLVRPLTLPGGKMRLIHRVVELDPQGGAWQLGKIVGQADIDPKAWFLTCHFVDDKVMPGTLMYECCLHTLRVLLLAYGWVGESEVVSWQPILNHASRLKCRGQVLESTHMVTYEVHIQELREGPEPQAVAFARMYADGKAIVDIEEMTVRLVGTTSEALGKVWQQAQTQAREWQAQRKSTPRERYSRAAILAFSTGLPSAAFGERYRVFDGDRSIARLPRPPFQFLDRVIEVGGEPFEMKAGAWCETEFDLDPNHWTLTVNGDKSLPFSVLLEVALQPCGWLAAYVGSALMADHDLRFRNLGGKATLTAYGQHALQGQGPDTLAVRARLLDVSQSAGMIVQNFDFVVSSRRDQIEIYRGRTTFGFFSLQALAHQVGIRGATWQGEGENSAYAPPVNVLPRGPGWPIERYRMIDRIDVLSSDGGPSQLGAVEGHIAVDPDAWFFHAHFYRDPVWPGSLGLEAFVQLVTLWMRTTHHRPQARVTMPDFATDHVWTYRGQILPSDRLVRVQAWPTAQVDATTWRFAGQLAVDGRIIYRMEEFTARLADEVHS